MADTNHKKDSEGSDSTDLAAAISLLALNPTNHNNDSVVSDSTDLTAAISLLDLNSITQPMAVDQEMLSFIPKTSLPPVKKRFIGPGQCHCRGNNVFSNKESFRPLVNVNHTQRYVPGSASRKLAPEACCFIRELSTMDADHDVGRLYLTRDEAKTIPTCPQMMTEVPKNMRKFSALMVFDYQDVQWNIMLNCYKYEGNILYLLSVDAWRNFLRAHELGHGDTIFFYKNIDSRINADGYYYVILFWRVRDGGFKTFLDLPYKRRLQESKNWRDFCYQRKCVENCRKFW